VNLPGITPTGSRSCYTTQKDMQMAKGQITTEVSGADFGAVLQAVRMRAGISQTEACKRSGVSISQWSRWESGRVIPYLASMAVIAEVFSLNDADLGAMVRLVTRGIGDAE
jgi:DNA-binding XRE family transcriptional regulator